ncbi:P27 family phage terminase small subunit [Bacillus cereus]
MRDIEERGVVVEWSNGKQQEEKNESIGELDKTNAQMLKLLAELGLKATEVEVGEDDETPDL